MFSQRILFRLIVGVLVLTHASAGLAGESGASGMGGGGNYLGREFVRYARDGINLLLSNPCFPQEQVDVKALRAKLEIFTKEGEQRVKATQDALFVIDPNTGIQLPVDALNYPRLDLIEFNIARWSALSDQGKRRLASHEFFGLIGAEGSNDFHLSDPASQDQYEAARSEIKRLVRSHEPVELEAVLDISPKGSAFETNLWIDYDRDDMVEQCGLERLAEVSRGKPDPDGDCEVIWPRFESPNAGWAKTVRWNFSVRGTRLDGTRFKTWMIRMGDRTPYRFRIYVKALGESAGLLSESKDVSVGTNSWIHWKIELDKLLPSACPKSAP